MLVQNDGYPGTKDVLSGESPNENLSATIDVALNNPSARLRFNNIVVSGPSSPYGFKIYNDEYDEDSSDGDGIELLFSYGYSGPNPFQFDGTASGLYSFVFSSSNMPPNDEGNLAFSFDIQINEGSGWRALENSDGTITWSDPSNILQGDPSSTVAVCFWRDKIACVEDCEEETAPPAVYTLNSSNDYIYPFSNGGFTFSDEFEGADPPGFVTGDDFTIETASNGDFAATWENIDTRYAITPSAVSFSGDSCTIVQGSNSWPGIYWNTGYS